MVFKASPAIDRVLSRYSVNENGCWIYLGSKDKDGYGVVGVLKKQKRAQRVVFEYFFGEIPSGMFVCHKCDVRQCINPEHLFIGTPRDNTADMISKGRAIHPRGELHPASKLKHEDVLKIRKMRESGEKLSAIASKFGISFQHVSAIEKGIVWK